MKKEEVAGRLYQAISYRIEYDTLDALMCDERDVCVEISLGEYLASVTLDICYRDIGQGKVYHEIPYIEVNEVVVTTSDAYHNDIADYICSKLDCDIECINDKLASDALQVA